VRTAESLAPSAGASSSVAAAASSSTEAAAKVAAAPAVAAADDGQAETFRFHGGRMTDGHVDGLDFGSGDKLALRHFDAGTFEGIKGGNHLQVSADGSFAKIDSFADLRELDRASSKVAVHADGDTLVIDIDQKGADHTIELAGLGHVYADLI